MVDGDMENDVVEQDLLILGESRLPSAVSNIPLPLLILYGMNGVTLALPTTALLFIVNTHVEIPLAYLPTYAAFVFLPFSLKPLYGYLAQQVAADRRHRLLSSLLFSNAILVALTICIPRGSVLTCFFVAFWRETANAFAEFLLGVTLVDNYCRPDTAACLQSQAATARNIGSLIAHGVALAFLSQVSEMTRTAAVVLLLSTAVVTFVASMIAFMFYVGCKPVIDELSQTSASSSASYGSSLDLRDGEEMVLADEMASSEPLPSSNNARLVALLQGIIILLCLRGPINEVSSTAAWAVLLAGSLIALVATASTTCRTFQWGSKHTVGCFLILRHVVPSIAYVMDSFIYESLQHRPALLQSLSVVGMAITTLSSWSYGKLWSVYHHVSDLSGLIVLTTLGAALASLANLALVHHSPTIPLLLGVKTLTTFVDEWNFLPDVILATVSVVGSPDTALEYGSLVSCINFGDQIGALLAAPLIAGLSMDREKGWNNLDVLIELCAALTLASAVLVRILPSDKPCPGAT